MMDPVHCIAVIGPKGSIASALNEEEDSEALRMETTDCQTPEVKQMSHNGLVQSRRIVQYNYQCYT
jgi:hypothetical protein